MRSRYTAYVVRDVDYLLKTWHSSIRPAALDPLTIPEWYGLQLKLKVKKLAEIITYATSQESTLLGGDPPRCWRRPNRKPSELISSLDEMES